MGGSVPVFDEVSLVWSVWFGLFSLVSFVKMESKGGDINWADDQH